MSFFSKYHCTFKEIGVCKDVTRQLRQLVSRVNKSSLCNVLVVYCIVFMLCFFFNDSIKWGFLYTPDRTMSHCKPDAKIISVKI